MSESVFRAFLGLPVPPSAQRALVRLQSHFRHAGIRGKWVKPENFHITLRFIGNITYADMECLDEALTTRLEHCAALHLALQGTGVFPNADRPTVVWAGIRQLGGDDTALYETVDASARSIGLAADALPFNPHITLFRMRQFRQHGALMRCLEKTREIQEEDYWVDNVALWKSELRPSGAVYHVLKEFPLKSHQGTL